MWSRGGVAAQIPVLDANTHVDKRGMFALKGSEKVALRLQTRRGPLDSLQLENTNALTIHPSIYACALAPLCLVHESDSFLMFLA